jgi:hypothetical protein
MPTTPNYGWSYPGENTDPWFGAVNSLVAAQDLTVRSVENLVPTRATVILSSGVIATEVSVQPGAWWPWPYGGQPGSFTLITSGAQVWFTLMIGGYAQANAPGFFPNAVSSGTGLGVQFRVIINPGSLDLIGPTATRRWQAFYQAGLLPQLHTFTAVVSLAPGPYSAQLQRQVVLGPATDAGQGSSWLSVGPIQLLAVETLVGT